MDFVSWRIGKSVGGRTGRGLRCWHGDRLQQVRPDLVLEIEDEDVRGVGCEYYVFARVGHGSGKALEICAVRVNRRRGKKGRHLICKEGGFCACVYGATRAICLRLAHGAE